ncbi:MAG: AmmeMemoRadiSam system radical SAM enzyme [Candidatus Nitrospinota bacterium M3_3B_026]
MTVAEGLHPALYWEKEKEGRVRCVLCPFRCLLGEGKIGICRGKQNIEGSLYAINYARTTSMNMDPIEKKPLYHFYPGSHILSIGPNGCNLGCDFCQNWAISQKEFPTTYLPPEDAVGLAETRGSIGIAYTYTEPLIWFEYVLDTSKLAREAGLVNVLVTNGMINPEPMEELLPYIDAMNIDLKSMDPAFYRKVSKGKLEPVLDTIRRCADRTHVEITNLLIPGLNDSTEMIEKLTDFIAGLDPLIPLHFSRYFPGYKRTTPPTPMESLLRAAHIAEKRLKYVFIGNIASEKYNQTRCPECGETIIERAGYTVLKTAVRGGECQYCGAKTAIVAD